MYLPEAEFGRLFVCVCQRLNFNHEFIMLIICGDAGYFVIFQLLFKVFNSLRAVGIRTCGLCEQPVFI